MSTFTIRAPGHASGRAPRRIGSCPLRFPRTLPNLARELDVTTSLALSRATTRAVCQLTADARRAVLHALESEVRAQETQGGPVAELVAALIASYADELK